MEAVEIYGASDDLVEVSGCKGADEFGASYDRSGYAGSFNLTSPSGQEMRVHAIYDGCWSFAIGQSKEDKKLPAWPVNIEQHERGYSTHVTILVPAGTRCRWEG